VSEAEAGAAGVESAFPYALAATEEPPCNLCGGRDVEPVCARDRNGLAVRSVICRRCGLLFLSPRMTREWYARYYEVEYRRQMAAYKRLARDHDLEVIWRAQLRRGEWLAAWLRRHGVVEPKSILEVGSSTGGLLRALADAFGARVLGIEPSPEEAEFAGAHDVPTEVGLFESFGRAIGERFDLVLCSQAFNHLLDPRRAAERVRELLAEDGLFFVECQDFFQVARARGAIAEAVQVDHVYMFAPETLQALVRQAGYAIVEGSLTCDRELSAEERAAQKELGLPTLHLRFLARPGPAPEAPTSSYAAIRAELAALPDSPLRARARHALDVVARRLHKRSVQLRNRTRIRVRRLRARSRKLLALVLGRGRR
jgi:SAM-dependent methyltransferase